MILISANNPCHDQTGSLREARYHGFLARKNEAIALIIKEPSVGLKLRHGLSKSHIL